MRNKISKTQLILRKQKNVDFNRKCDVTEVTGPPSRGPLSIFATAFAQHSTSGHTTPVPITLAQAHKLIASYTRTRAHGRHGTYAHEHLDLGLIHSALLP